MVIRVFDLIQRTHAACSFDDFDNGIFAGGDRSAGLESELGRRCIAGITTLSTFRIGNPEIGDLNLQQDGARFSRDGQNTCNMVERSSHERLSGLADHAVQETP